MPHDEALRPGQRPHPQGGHPEELGGALHLVPEGGEQLHLPHLLLPDLVVAVGDEILSDLRQGEGDPGVGLGGRGEGGDLHVEVLVQVLVLGVVGQAEVLLLG